MDMKQGFLPDALSVDVEEYFHATVFEGVIPRTEWESRRGRVAGPVRRLLDAFAAWDVRATFFFLGWVAEREPALVRAVCDAGHEVASHGSDHRLVSDLSPDAFREDLRRVKGTLESITGHAVIGYRAPTFSITERTLWALPILAEEGFAYDSSVFPIRHDRYGIPGFPRHPVRLRFGDRSLVEVPPSAWRVGPWNAPLAGGGYLRLLPLALFRAGHRAIRREGRPVVLYVHPWELDPGQPRVPLGRLARARHYGGLDRTAERLEKLVRGADFIPLAEMIRRRPIPAWSLGAPS
jgi:polysaccharide deacetylase family protein (PEP-CTERM system associated)